MTSGAYLHDIWMSLQKSRFKHFHSHICVKSVAMIAIVEPTHRVLSFDSVSSHSDLGVFSLAEASNFCCAGSVPTKRFTNGAYGTCKAVSGRASDPEVFGEHASVSRDGCAFFDEVPGPWNHCSASTA